MSTVTARESGSSLRVALMLPASLEDRLVAEIAAAGDDVVLRAANVSELITRAAAGDLDLIVVQGMRGKLTPELIGSCDLTSVKLLALCATDADREHAASLSFAQTADATAEWGTMLLALERGQVLDSDATVIGVPRIVEDALGGVAGGLLEEPPATSAKTARLKRRKGAAETALNVATELIPGSGGQPAVSSNSSPNSSPSPSRVIAVWGPTGAPGRTSVAINVAAELAQQGQRTLLIDADTYGGSVALALGLIDETPGIAAACRQAHKEAFTREEFDRIVQFVDVGVGSSASGQLSVLTGISRSDRWPEIAGDRIGSVLKTCREWFDVIVCDVGFNLETDEEITSDMFAPRRNMATLAVLKAADAVLEVTGSEPVALARYLRAHRELTDAFPGKASVTVANRVRSGAAGLSPEQQVTHTLERFGGIHKPVLLPHDEKAAELMGLRAAPACTAAPKSKLRAGYLQITERLENLQVAEKNRQKAS